MTHKGDCLCKEMSAEHGPWSLLVSDNWFSCPEERECCVLCITYALVMFGERESVKLGGEAAESAAWFIGSADLEAEACLAGI